MNTLKKVKNGLFISLMLLAALALGFPAFAPTPSMAASPEIETMRPAVSVIPNVGNPGQKVLYVGANFEPGQKVILTILVAPGIENTLYSPKDPSSIAFTVNELGSFRVENRIPRQLKPGAYPVRVYTEDWEILASAVVVVKKPKAKKK